MRYQLRYVRMLPTGLARLPALARARTVADPGSRIKPARAHGRSLANIWLSASSTFIHKVSFPGRTMS
jgi:hypothetical protein